MYTPENTFSIKASLTANIYTEKPDLYVAHCAALDLYSQGPTSESAEKNIIAATEAFICSCLRRNTLNDVLVESGFRSVDAKPTNKKAARKATLPDSAKLRSIRFLAELPVMVE